MTIIDTSHPLASPFDSESSLTFGRAATINEVLSHLANGRDVLIEGEAGLGKAALRASLSHAARAAGWRVIDYARLRSSVVSGPTILIDALDPLTPTDISTIAAMQTNQQMRFVLTRRPPHPFVPAPDLARIPVVARAATVALEPLTAAECDALIEEQVSTYSLRHKPSLTERRWVWAKSGGFPALAVSVLHDADDAPDEEDSLSMLSRRTLLAASEITGGLPVPLQRLAAQLLPLVGVSFTRLRRFFDRVELSLLRESHVITDHNDTLCITPPVRAALRILTDAHEPNFVAQDVLADICASAALDTECTESEIDVASQALASDPALRDHIDLDTQEDAIVMGMWLARRRGDSAVASSLARRLMTINPARQTDEIRRVARNLPDDIPALAESLRAGDKAPAPHICTWGLCLQIPLTTAPSGTDDLLEEILKRADTPEKPRVASYRQSVAVSAAFERGDHDEALSLARDVLNDPNREPLAAIRAITVVAAVHSLRLNHDALRQTALEFAAVAQSISAARGLERDLGRRMLIDSAATISILCGGAGMRVPAEMEKVADVFLTDGLIGSDPSAVALSTAIHLMSSAQKDQQDELSASVRLLIRKRRTDTANWIISLLSEDGPVIPPAMTASPYVANAVTNAKTLTLGMQQGIDAFRVAVERAPQVDTPALTVAHLYVATVAGEYPHIVPEYDGLAIDTAPGAMLAYCRGIRDSDVALLRSAATAFHAMGAGEQAQAALDALAPLVTGDDTFERTLRPLRRNVTTMLRSMKDPDARLTPREYEVALLASQGLRNAEIAQRMFLSIRTVESHLYRAMRKLSVEREGLHPALLQRHAGQ